MTTLAITKKGTLRLPREVLRHLCNTRQLRVHLDGSSITLTPVPLQLTLKFSADALDDLAPTERVATTPDNSPGTSIE